MIMTKNAGRPVMAVFAADKQDKNLLINTLSGVIGHAVEIKGYALDEGMDGPLDLPVVLTSGKFLFAEAKRLFPGSCIISSKRVITGHNLEKVIMLPKNKKVLVVNHTEASTRETIESLINLGIDHVQYVPYWKGFSGHFEAFDTAISPARIHLCPQHIQNQIDSENN